MFGGHTVGHGNVQVTLPGHLSWFVYGLLRCWNTNRSLVQASFPTIHNFWKIQIEEHNNREIYNCAMLPFTLSAHRVWTCYFVFRNMCKNFARCHFKPLWTVMSKIILLKTKVTFFQCILFLTAHSCAQSFGRKRMTAWHRGRVSVIIIILNLGLELWSEQQTLRGWATFQVTASECDEPRRDEVVHVLSSSAQVFFPIMTW